MSEAQDIENRIDSIEPGKLFITSDFLDIADTVNVNNVLSRLARAGRIERVVRGVYAKPKFSSFLQEYLIPDVDAVAHAIARNNHWTIAPAGDIALNRLGLDTQVPAVYQYVSSGPYKKYAYGKFTIEMLHRANRDMIDYSPVTMLVIQALKAKGKERVDEETLSILSGKLNDDQIGTLVSETRETTAWIHEFAKKLNERHVHA